MKTSLVSFVGTNDRGSNINGIKSDGAILTALKERKYNTLHLFHNPTKSGNINFYDIAIHVREIAIKKKYFKKKDVFLHSFECENVTDHNEIYPKLLNLCKSLPKGGEYTSAIASGTPAMQVCWILMAESGDFKIKLIRSNEPKFGKPLVSEVKLGTGLPRIKRLEKDNVRMIKEIKNHLKPVLVNIREAKITIDGIRLKLSNVETCYYYYFLFRAYFKKQGLQVANNYPGDEFVNSINNYFKKFFPELEKTNSKSTSFQSNISKVNKKIKEQLGSNKTTEFYLINSEGTKGRKSYLVDLPTKLINIK